MAKKWQKKVEEDKYDFKYPDFDEKEYLVKELKETRVLFTTVAYAVLIAFVSLGVMIFLGRDATLGFLIGVIAIISLRYIYPIAKIDISAFDTKKWVMSALSFFGIWLAVWILLCNPPVSDFTPPQITKISATAHGGGSELKDGIVKVNLGGTGGVTVNATITDNFHLDKGSIRFTVYPSGQESNILNSSVSQVKDNKYCWAIPSISLNGQYIVSMTAKDTWNNEKTLSFTLVVEA